VHRKDIKITLLYVMSMLRYMTIYSSGSQTFRWREPNRDPGFF